MLVNYRFILFILLGFFIMTLIGCSENPMGPEMVQSNGCGLDISSTLPYDEIDESYELEFNANLAQTYTRLDASTNCGWSQRLMWDSNYQYQINNLVI